LFLDALSVLIRPPFYVLWLLLWVHSLKLGFRGHTVGGGGYQFVRSSMPGQPTST